MVRMPGPPGDFITGDELFNRCLPANQRQPGQRALQTVCKVSFVVFVLGNICSRSCIPNVWDLLRSKERLIIGALGV